MKTQFQSLPDIIKGADLVLGASLVFALSSLAEAMNIRYRFIAFAPQILPSSYHPYMAFKHQELPQWVNKLGWQVAGYLDRFNFTGLINNYRHKLGLAPLKSFWKYNLGEDVILASDPEIARSPPDATVSSIQTGYMHLVQPSWKNPGLEAFLGKGSPPLYAGFGSMPKQDQASRISTIVKAARANGLRVVVAKFWDEPSEFCASDDVFFIQKYPHLDLFPRMAAVIHHGGVGTTATTARSGVPQIIVPHILDQYYWGDRIHKSLLGPKPIWRAKLTDQKLARAIQEAITNQELIDNAREVGEKLQQKNPLKLVVKEIEGYT